MKSPVKTTLRSLEEHGAAPSIKIRPRPLVASQRFGPNKRRRICFNISSQKPHFSPPKIYRRSFNPTKEGTPESPFVLVAPQDLEPIPNTQVSRKDTLYTNSFRYEIPEGSKQRIGMFSTRSEECLTDEEDFPFVLTPPQGDTTPSWTSSSPHKENMGSLVSLAVSPSFSPACIEEDLVPSFERYSVDTSAVEPLLSTPPCRRTEVNSDNVNRPPLDSSTMLNHLENIPSLPELQDTDQALPRSSFCTPQENGHVERKTSQFTNWKRI